MAARKVLVIGKDSGVGRYLKAYESFLFEKAKVTYTSSKVFLGGTAWDIVIYCSHRHDIDETLPYIQSNINALAMALEYRTRQFVYFSSVDVLPKTGSKNIAPKNIDTLYGITKYECEKLVSERHGGVILRPSMIINPFGRKNTIEYIKEQSTIRLSAHSIVNCVSVHSIGKFIKSAIVDNARIGPFNLTSRAHTTVNEILCATSKAVGLGSYDYRLPTTIDNYVESALEPSLEQSSLNVAANYINYGVY